MTDGSPEQGRAPQRLHSTRDIPQADRLENVRQLVAAVREGIHNPSALRQLLDVDHRHFAYYRQAATILGFITVDPDNAVALNDAAKSLLAAPEGSDAERNCFREAIRGARALKPLGSFFEGEEVSFDEVAMRLQTLTGLAPATAERRARTLIQWRRFLQVQRPTSTGPDLPNLTPQLEALVARHNALAKQQYLEWLLKMNPSDFERLVGELVVAMEHREVVVCGRSGDGGLDIRARRIDQWGHSSPIGVQVKRYSKPIGRRVLDELIGTVSREHLAAGIIITTSEFTTGALAAAEQDVRLQLVDGARLVDLLAKHGVGIQLGRYAELALKQG